MVASKKKSKQGDNINSSLALMVKSGKYALGTKQTIQSLRSGKCTFFPFPLYIIILHIKKKKILHIQMKSFHTHTQPNSFLFLTTAPS